MNMGCDCFKKRTKAWWYCNKCSKYLVAVNSGLAKDAMRKHAEICPGAVFRIKQIAQ